MSSEITLDEDSKIYFSAFSKEVNKNNSFNNKK
jgi:hypothetical protein